MDLRNGFDIRRYIRTIPDYPKPGILFRDITTLLADLHGFRAAVDELAWPFLRGETDYVAGIEARGFILGGAVAVALEAGFVVVRKAGKLPHTTIGVDYDLEYGTDRVEVHTDAIRAGERVLVIDDLIATGGTALASVELIEQAGGVVVGCGFIIDLPDLGGAARIRERGIAVHCLCAFEGE
jgi:adenine phosphoribosyltransferase